jgi:hypothetical protein
VPVRALCAVKLTATDRMCTRLAAPVSLPESDTAKVPSGGIARFEPALTAPESAPFAVTVVASG